MKPVGLQIGDRWLAWSHDGSSARVPARVSAVSRPGSHTGEIAYLLAGDEAEGDAGALGLPRRSGYRWNDSHTSQAILQALLARVRQALPPVHAPGLVLAVPYWVQAYAPELTAAAEAAGWGDITLVTDLHVLALAAGTVDDQELLLTVVPGSDQADAGLWRRAGEAWVPLAWETWYEAEVPDRLRALLDRAGARVPLAAVGGDLAPEWLQSGFGALLESCGCRVADLGSDGVAVAAAAWSQAPALPVADLKLFVETAAGPVPVPGFRQAPAVWRALAAGDQTVTVRLAGRWALESECRLTLWEGVVRSDHDPLLLHVHWQSDEAADLSLHAAGKELTRERMVIRNA